MRPKTPQEMYSILLKGLLIRAYGDITEAARRNRLTEHDIALIELNTLDLLKTAPDFADEFTTFEVEPLRAGALREAEDFFLACRNDRRRKIADRP